MRQAFAGRVILKTHRATTANFVDGSRGGRDDIFFVGGSVLHEQRRYFGNAPLRVRPWEIVKEKFNIAPSQVSFMIPIYLFCSLVGIGVTSYYERVCREKSNKHVQWAKDYNKTAHWSKQRSGTDDL